MPAEAAGVTIQAMLQSYSAAGQFQIIQHHTRHAIQPEHLFAHRFISKAFRAYVQERCQHLRIAYRMPIQLERFHQKLKTEEVYRRLYESPADARRCLGEFRVQYNVERPQHWALKPLSGCDVVTPSDVYVDGLAIDIPCL